MVQNEPDLRTVVYPGTAFAPETGSSGWMTCHSSYVSTCLPHYGPKIKADQPDRTHFEDSLQTHARGGSATRPAGHGHHPQQSGRDRGAPTLVYGSADPPPISVPGLEPAHRHRRRRKRIARAPQPCRTAAYARATTADPMTRAQLTDWRLRSTAGHRPRGLRGPARQHATDPNRAGNLERIFDPTSCADRVRSSFAPVCQPEMTPEDHA